MRGYWIRGALLAVAVGMTGPALRAQQRSPAEVRLQAAIHTEEVEGSLQRAIELYREVVSRYGSERDVAARALLYLGRTYEKLGSQEATRAYQRVVREYGDQTTWVAQARTRLAALSVATVAARGPAARRVVSVWDVGQDVFHHIEPSPDGRRVVYINMTDGGVYVYDVGSGDRQLVTPGLPTYWNHFPIWSPDGRRVAFSEENLQTRAMDIKIVDLASRDAVVVPGTQARWTDVEQWSKDGRYLLCNPGEDSLGVIPVGGGTMRVLTDSAYKGNGALSPDGRFVAYAVGNEGDAQIFVQPLAGGTRRQITWAPGGSYRPHWAPDGRAIAYQRADGIWVVPVADGAPSGDARLAVSVTNFRLSRWSEAGLYYTQFSGLGRSLAPHQLPMDPTTGRPAPGGLQILLGEHPDSIGGFAWSPDMRRVAFGHARVSEVTVYSADTRTVRTYDPGRLGHALFPGWSRDGRELVYEPYGIWSGGEGTTVVALDIATGQVRELFPRIPNAAGISLSAEGRIMTYYRLGPADSGQSDPGSLVSRLTSAGARVRAVVVGRPGQRDALDVATAGSPGETPFSGQVRPQLSPQGDRVLYVRQAGVVASGQRTPQASTLWVVGSDGRGARRIGAAAFIRSAVWDPSGRFIAYSGKPDVADGSTAFIRVVEVATGVETQIPLPSDFARNLGMWEHLIVTDWSSDGSRLGILPIRGGGGGAPWEYWVVQGLLEGGR